MRVTALLEVCLEQVAAHGLPQTDVFGKCDPYCVASVGPEEVARTDIVKCNLNPSFSVWQTTAGTRGPAVTLGLACTSDLQPDPHSRCPPRLTVMDWNRFSGDKIVCQPLSLHLTALEGLWSSAPQRRALSLPLSPAAAGPRLSLTLYTEAVRCVCLYVCVSISLSLSLFFSLSLYVCMYVCMYLCMYVCMYVLEYVCTYVRYVRMYLSYVCVYACVCVCVCVCICICMCIYVYSKEETAGAATPPALQDVEEKDLRLQVFVRSGLNLPLNKCHSCRGVLPVGLFYSVIRSLLQ